MPDDHSKLVPLLPISNRTVKRLSADDSAGSRVKVGHRQASNSPKRLTARWGVLLCAKHFLNALFLFALSTGYSPIDQNLVCSNTSDFKYIGLNQLACVVFCEESEHENRVHWWRPIGPVLCVVDEKAQP